MISEQDITQLKEVFATKEQHEELSQKVDGIQEIVGDLKVEVGEMNDRLNDKLDTLIITVDGFVGSVRTLEQENAFGAGMLGRHERQLDVLGVAVGITLPD
ncbi:MAG: hypothetical protein P4M11_11520 [Candidatus Pacebacteria bacterium]|nr:hypothetical protein [Candidatus Paceibacterota bacterium]